MILAWTRTSKELKDVLMNQDAQGPATVYWIFTEIAEKKWKNMTVITQGSYGGEFPKTYGHYHAHNVLETYRMLSGEAMVLLQKKFYTGDKWDPTQVAEVYLVKLEVGEELTVPLEFAHSISNLGTRPLITFDDWHSGHTSTDYKEIKNLRGMSFYLTQTPSGVKFVPNPNYKNLPEPKLLTVKEFEKIYPNS